MSRKSVAVCLCVVITVGAVAVHDYLGHQVRAACAASPGSEPSFLAQAQSAISLLVAAMGGVGGVIAYLHKWADAFPPDPVQKLAVVGVNIGSMAVYADLFKKSKIQAERDAIKTAAKTLNDDLFNEWFTTPITGGQS
jgi:hypothetical protein